MTTQNSAPAAPAGTTAGGAPAEGHIHKVIFADFAVVKFTSVIQALKNANIVAEAVTDPPKFLANISEEYFDVCVLNLLLGGIGPFELIANVRSISKNRAIKIIVISRQLQKENIHNTIRAGANDFVAEPFEPENLHERILYHLAPKQVIDPGGYEKTLAGEQAVPYVNVLLEATELLSRTDRAKEHSTFFKVLGDVANLLDSNRTSLIIVDAETDSGLVLASSDDENFYDFPISLHKYPEILDVMHTGNLVLIEDTSRNQMTQKLNETVRSIQIGSLMVFPVRFQNEVMGVLTIRRPKATELPPMDVLRVMQAIANTLAAQSNVKVLLRKIWKDFRPAGAAKAG